MFWYAPTAPRYVNRDVAVPQARVEDVTREVPDPREADLSIVVYRAPVNQPPTIVAETTQLVVQEDAPAWLKFVVTDPDAEESLEHMLSLTLDCQHGHLRSLAVATALRSQGGKKILFRGTLTRINAFLEQVEYWPDPNYHGVDTLIAVIDDHGFTSAGVSRDLDNILTPGLQDSTTVPVVVVPVHDAPVLVCPSSVVTFEDKSAIIGTEIMYKDVDQIDVANDGLVPARLEMSVSGGGMTLDLTDITLQAHFEFPAPHLVFEATVQRFREVLHTIEFTPPPGFHGLLLWNLRVQVPAGVSTCDITIVVNPSNDPPSLIVHHEALPAVVARGEHIPVPAFTVDDADLVRMPKLPLAMADATPPRLEVGVSVSCGVLSLGILQPRDLLFGVGLMSISGTEGLTFSEGDGYQDSHMTFQSTPGQLNRALQQLVFHAHDCAEGFIELAATVSDLGGGAHINRTALTASYSEPKAILVLAAPVQLW
jgi:hypothetical protein